jgi:hypothetical protein
VLQTDMGMALRNLRSKCVRVRGFDSKQWVHGDKLMVSTAIELSDIRIDWESANMIRHTAAQSNNTR